MTDLMNYAMLGGVERIAIIAGAVLIGYWGYRMQSKAQTPGLVFMAVACVMLAGALLTTGSHMRTVSASMTAGASVPTPEPVQVPMAATTGAPNGSPATTVVALAADAEGLRDGSAALASDPQPLREPPQDVLPSEAATGDTGALDTAAASPDDASDDGVQAVPPPEATGSLVPLATGSELGGRIVSIRSENVTLEWAEDRSRARN